MVSAWVGSYQRRGEAEAIVVDAAGDLAVSAYLVVESLVEDYGTTPHAAPAPPEKLAKAATTSRVPEDPGALTAKELTDLSASLSTSELWTLRELEAAGKARSTVLRAIDRKLDR